MAQTDYMNIILRNGTISVLSSEGEVLSSANCVSSCSLVGTVLLYEWAPLQSATLPRGALTVATQGMLAISLNSGKFWWNESLTTVFTNQVNGIKDWADVWERMEQEGFGTFSWQTSMRSGQCTRLES